VLYLWLIILLIGDDVSVDSDTLLVTVTDFVNLKIKSTQSFRGGYMGRIYVCVFIQMSIHIYIYKYLYLYCISDYICANYSLLKYYFYFLFLSSGARERSDHLSLYSANQLKAVLHQNRVVTSDTFRARK
jgi:hypothetical protein